MAERIGDVRCLDSSYSTVCFDTVKKAYELAGKSAPLVVICNSTGGVA